MTPWPSFELGPADSGKRSEMTTERVSSRLLRAARLLDFLDMGNGPSRGSVFSISVSKRVEAKGGKVCSIFKNPEAEKCSQSLPMGESGIDVVSGADSVVGLIDAAPRDACR